jgi:hypothetical protein
VKRLKNKIGVLHLAKHVAHALCVQCSHSCERDMFRCPSGAIPTNRADSPDRLNAHKIGSQR